MCPAVPVPGWALLREELGFSTPFPFFSSFLCAPLFAWGYWAGAFPIALNSTSDDLQLIQEPDPTQISSCNSPTPFLQYNLPSLPLHATLPSLSLWLIGYSSPVWQQALRLKGHLCRLTPRLASLQLVRHMCAYLYLFRLAWLSHPLFGNQARDLPALQKIKVCFVVYYCPCPLILRQ